MKLLTFCSQRDTAEAVARLLSPHAAGLELTVVPTGGRFAVGLDTEGRTPRPLVEALRNLRASGSVAEGAPTRSVDEALTKLQMKRIEERAKIEGVERARRAQREMWKEEG